ncbi:MAG TPA: M50 family metallopeptidase [Patescibacteria group bacterium]
MQIIVFVLILSVLVLIHEFGHFLMAKAFGMRVEEFGIGLPPRAKSLFTKAGTLFSLNWLPLGGFVKLYGEDYEDEEQLASKEAFFNKPAWQRCIVLLAGVTMNFALGVLLFGVVYSYLGIPTETTNIHIVEVTKDSPAEKAGIQVDGIIKNVSFGKDNYEFKTTQEFIKVIDSLKGKQIELTMENKDGKIAMYKLTPRENPPAGQGALGVALSNIEMKKYPWWQMPFRGVVVGMQEAISWGKEILNNLGTLLYGIFTGKGIPKDVAGPVGIYEVSKQVYQFGWTAVLQFMGVLSVNLAILNVMPFPALDGGRIAFLGVEKIIGKKRKNKIEGYVHTAGMILLLLLMVLITARDIYRLVTHTM